MIALTLYFRIDVIEVQRAPFVHAFFMSLKAQALQLRFDGYIHMCLGLNGTMLCFFFKGNVTVVSIFKHHKWSQLPVHERGPFFPNDWHSLLLFPL